MAKKSEGQRDSAKERYWRQMLGLLNESGLSQAQFCKEHNLMPTRYRAGNTPLEIATKNLRPKLRANRGHLPNSRRSIRQSPPQNPLTFPCQKQELLLPQ